MREVSGSLGLAFDSAGGNLVSPSSCLVMKTEQSRFALSTSCCFVMACYLNTTPKTVGLLTSGLLSHYIFIIVMVGSLADYVYNSEKPLLLTL